MHQDWEVITWRKKSAASTSSTHRHRSHLSATYRKLESDLPPPQTSSLQMRQMIQQGRAAKCWTQKQLAEQCGSVSTATIRAYENGKSIPPPHVRSKLNHVLGVRLPKQ